MTDRLNAFVVVLARDLRDDDAQATLDAIGQLKGVLTVTPHIADVGDLVAGARVRDELGAALWAVLHPTTKERR